MPGGGNGGVHYCYNEMKRNAAWRLFLYKELFRFHEISVFQGVPGVFFYGGAVNDKGLPFLNVIVVFILYGHHQHGADATFGFHFVSSHASDAVFPDADASSGSGRA